MQDPLETARKIDALGLWGRLAPHHWAVKPAGSAIPYFCAVRQGEKPPVKARLLLLEGWQVFQDYLRLLVDPNYGFYVSPMELPHFELVVLEDGAVNLFRHDAGYVPRELAGREPDLVSRLLWEAYGVAMRIETDANLPLSFSDRNAVFARAEAKDGTWRDEPLAIPPARPHVESVRLPKDLMKRAKDLPFAKDDVLEVDFGLLPGVMTREARPRLAYALVAFDERKNARVLLDRVSMDPEYGLRGLWEGLAPRLLARLVERGSIPGELKTRSQRVFRLLRPLVVELPFRLSLHDSLPGLA